MDFVYVLQPKFAEPQRRLEQLILHVRSLHLLSAALQMARDEIKSGHLTISNSVKAGRCTAWLYIWVL